jgi:uncharacterized protein YdeI (BOF family)
MKIMKFFACAAAALAMIVGCQEKEQNLGTPEISISESEMTFEAVGGDKDLTVTATRDWKVETDADWVVVSPGSGSASVDPQTVTVSVLENDGLDRTADLMFTIGLKKKYLTVTQAGPGGSAADLIVYSNDFDIEKAQNNSGWPYLDSNYNLWDNKKGTGASTVEYEFGGKMSVRTSGKASNDGSGYSHYEGSGTNKIFFGAATSVLKINKITLGGTQTDFALSFGGQKYLQDGDSNFSWDEFKVYVSNDAQKWVELAMAFPADADVEGDWNLASCNFTVPAGTAQLCVAFVSSCSSAYSIYDVLLEVASEAGQVIDFSAGVEIGGTTGGNTGGNTGDNTGGTTDQPATLVKATIAEFLAAAEDDTWYELTGEIINIAKTDYGNFTIKDETGEVYIYGMTSKWVGSNDKSFSQIGLKVTDVVTLGTRRTSYQGTPQGGGNPVPAFYISHIPGEGTGEDPEPPVSGEAGEFDSELTWTLGSNSYDKTSSGNSSQNAVVNGVAVSNLLKLGKSSAGGTATVNIPAGTTKVGFYACAWSNNNATVLTCNVGGQDVTFNLIANSGATGNPTYTLTLTESDYYTVDIPSGVTTMTMSTTGSSNCRALVIGLKAVTE